MIKSIYLILFSFISLSSFAQHGINTNWLQTLRQIPPVGTNDTLQGSVANNMVVDRSGKVIIFYKFNGINYWAGSSDNGLTWTSPTPSAVSPCQTTGNNSSISADIDTSGVIHIIWRGTSPYGLYYAKYSSSWTNAEKINTSVISSITFSQITIDRKNRLHVMWQDGDHNSSSDTAACFYLRSTNSGSNWSSQILLSAYISGKPAAFPVADFSGTLSDNLYISWREKTDNNINVNGWDVKGVRTSNGGLNWSSPAFAASGIYHQWDPNIVIDRNGIFHLMYHTYFFALTFQDTSAVFYKFSVDGGANWSQAYILSDTIYRSHLVKTAFDYSHNAVWCFWKDERDLVLGNPKADIIGKNIVYNGSVPVFSESEFISDGGATEYGYHNFKAGSDGIVRAHFNDIIGGTPKNLYSTQRTQIVNIFEENTELKNEFTVYPNPSNGYIIIRNAREGALFSVYDILGREILVLKAVSGNTRIDINRFGSGIYFLKEIMSGKNKTFIIVK